MGACSPLLFSRPTEFTPGSRITLRPLPPPISAREYTPARSADRHRPDAHCRSDSILSPAADQTLNPHIAWYKKPKPVSIAASVRTATACSG